MGGPVELAELETARVLAAVGLNATLHVSHRDGESDGFRWAVAGDVITIDGDSARGALFGAYDFLESLGVMWPVPGVEILPAHATLTHASGAGEPGLPGRCLIIAAVAVLPRLEEWVAWAARNKLNTVFFHTSPPGSGAIGAIPHDDWLAVRDRAVASVRERGLVFELGGHGLTHLLPRDRFADTPDAFRMVKGERRADTNFCSSSAVAIAAMREGSRAIFEANPEVDCFHIWPDDAGSWCHCPECESVSPSEQSMRAVVAVAETLADVNPHAQLAAIAYLETEDAPVSPPPSNVFMLWAPRKRCYGHDLSEPECAVNEPRYRAGFAELSRAFVARGAMPTRVFEYWLDGILFKSCFPVFAHVGADIAAYRDAGVHTVQSLLVGPRDMLGSWPAPWLYARQLWNPDADPAALLDDFARVALADPSAAAALRHLDEAMRLALQLEPTDDPDVRPRVKAIMKGGGFPDMEDPVGVLADGLRKIATRHDEALSLAEPAAAALASIAAAAEAEVVLRWIRFARARAHAYLALRTGGDAGELIDDAVARADDFAEFLCAQYDDDTSERIRFMHEYSWKRVLTAQLPDVAQPERHDGSAEPVV
ncbi:MAG: hypothetical protein QOJ00_898 [Actinomycetota bacterium]